MAKSKKVTVSIIVIVLILVVGGVLVALNYSEVMRAVGVTKPAPVFVYDESKGAGWWAVDNYNARESATDDNYEGTDPIESLPVANINVFSGEKGTYATACFVMFSYYDTKVDVAQLKKDKEQESLKSGTMRKVGQSKATLDVLGEAKEVTITNYTLVGQAAENSMRGMGYGWIDTDKGYISVSSVCPTPEELDSVTVPVAAMKLADL